MDRAADQSVLLQLPHGLPEPLARVFASFDVSIAEGGLDGVNGDFETLTGRKPQSFEDWLAANKAVIAAL